MTCGAARIVAGIAVATVFVGCASTRVAAPGAAARLADAPGPPPDALAARVVRVVDGDTVVLSGISRGRADSSGGRTVRFIGVDTPETSAPTGCLGMAATRFTRERLDDRRVLVTFDVDQLDRYGRALVYIWRADDRTFFNASLVAEGYALQLTIPPNVRYAELFSELVTSARHGRRGLWGAVCDGGLAGTRPAAGR